MAMTRSMQTNATGRAETVRMESQMDCCAEGSRKNKRKTKPQKEKARPRRRSARVSWWRLSFQKMKPTATGIIAAGMNEEMVVIWRALAADHRARTAAAPMAGLNQILLWV